MQFDINDVVLEMNGHTVEGGYSDDADAIMFEPIELAGEARVGADGSKAWFAKAEKAKGFTLKFLPSAPSIPFFQQQAGIVLNGGTVLWNGSVRDTRHGYSAQLRNGVMRQFQPFPNYGAEAVGNYEYMFEFEEIIPDYDAVTAGSFRAIGSAA
ncbi:MAG: hypothetical protein F4Y02_13690 [Chloroflexi bacterium]|nr:hypothetical protein [Chloroflexota bacterium]